MVDYAKVRRESMRWHILLTLNNARPIGANETLILHTLQAITIDATQAEMRRELDYLEERELVSIDKAPSGHWSAKLTRHGIDVAEYTVNVEAGIARPAKYWEN